MNRRPLRKKLGSRTSRRANTKRGKKTQPKPRTKLAKLIQAAAQPLRTPLEPKP